MKNSLYYKFIFGYLIFGLLGFITVATFSSQMIHKKIVQIQASKLYDNANMIASDYSSLYKGHNIDIASAYPQLEAVSTSLHSDIWIVDRKGTIIADSSKSNLKGSVIDGFDPVITGNKSYSIGKYYNMFHTDMLSVSAPIIGNYNTYGYVLIHMPLSQIIDEQYQLLDCLYITSLIVFALSLTILLVFTKTVYFPLKKITAAANEYAAGNLEYKIDISTNDEMGYLAGTLNYMSDEINKMEVYQRNFIANVSHDFRSPLTSIKGYLEAMLDGTIPPEMQEKYLRIVISETERLNKLTRSMLTLNTLDSKGYLSRNNFDINRVIKDTAASFEGTCNSKNIILDLTFSDNILMVYADLEKIQQVLYNLIDNAIKFSHDNSVIYIQSSVKHEKAFISIKDTGIGIPKNSIKKIWDRFYKTDLSRGKNKKGTGLGLAIVKEIIQSHGENIDVISTEGIGTEFIFTLPCSSNTL